MMEVVIIPIRGREIFRAGIAKELPRLADYCLKGAAALGALLLGADGPMNNVAFHGIILQEIKNLKGKAHSILLSGPGQV